jgi:putative sterol carrier protein
MRRDRRLTGAFVAIYIMLFAAGTHSARAASPLMSQDWAAQACEAWNAEPILTDGLIESEWIKNDAARGYKIIQLYRSDCSESPRVQIRVSIQDDNATCVYGGGVDKELDLNVDYIMYAETARWAEMGRGEYGPMRGMLFGRLRSPATSTAVPSNDWLINKKYRSP